MSLQSQAPCHSPTAPINWYVPRTIHFAVFLLFKSSWTITDDKQRKLVGAVILIFRWVKDRMNIANLSLIGGLRGWTQLYSISQQYPTPSQEAKLVLCGMTE